MNKIIETSCTEDTIHLTVLTERLDAYSAEYIKNEFEAIWFAHIQKIRIDMAKVEFIDSSGVGVLVFMAKRLPVDSFKVRLLKLKKSVRTVLDLLRLSKLFEIRGG